MPIYIPVEVSKREIFGKSLLAFHLATKGKHSYVFEHTFFDRYGYPGQGTYIGKNIFRTEYPTSQIYYKKLKKNKIKLLLLDEEGGIYNGGIKNLNLQLIKRFHIKTLNKKEDLILCWIQIQKKILKKKNFKAYLTGHPNFQVLEPKYNKLFKNIDLKITSGKKNFILINTRFAGLNTLRKKNEYFGKESGSSSLGMEMNIINSIKDESLVISNFLEVIFKIVTLYKNTKFVIRKHPEEDEELYKLIFQNCKNVTITNNGPVDSWIRQSKLVIAWGCTTILQSYLNNTPVLVLEPHYLKYIKNFNNYDVNKLGHKVQNFKKLKFFLTKKIDKKKVDKTFMRKIPSSENCVEKINQLINSNFKENNFAKFTKIFGIIENIKYFFKSFSKKKKQEIYFEDFNLMEDFIKEANKYYGETVKINKISKFVWKVYK